MITPEQMEDWIKEVEERPSSAALIVRFIANRLRDLTARNEELLSENIALRAGRKVEEYETRITNLEYQLDLLRRQLGGAAGVDALTAAGAAALANGPAPAAALSLLIFNTKGQVLRARITPDGLKHGKRAGRMKDICGADELPPRMLVTHEHEELLFVFDSGRTVTRPVSGLLPAENADALDWSQAGLIEPHGGEELTAVLPVGKMTLADYCVQASRRGCVKKMMRTSFESHVSKNYIGTGVKLKTDRTCCLVLGSKDDRFVMVSREGFVLTMEVNAMPYTVEEAIKLSATDHIVSGFTLNRKPSLLILTQNGKAIHRESSWLEPALSFNSRGQAAFPPSRREAGVRAAGAAAVGLPAAVGVPAASGSPVDASPNTINEEEWGITLHGDGALEAYRLSDLLSAGAVPARDGEITLLGFCAFTLPKTGKE